MIEKLILENLCSKLGLKYEEKEHRTFLDSLKEVQEKQQTPPSDTSKSRVPREKSHTTAQQLIQRSIRDAPWLSSLIVQPLEAK